MSFVTPASVQAPPDIEPLPALHALFDATGPILRDRNGDGSVDFVDAHFLLGDAPSPADIVAAANIGARFGYESAELNLPLPADGGRVAIAIGLGGVRQAGLSIPALGLDALAAGEGLVTVAGSASRPILVAAGRDAAGTLAAAEFAAARLPWAWDVKGVSLTHVDADVAAALTEANVCRKAGPTAVLVRSGADAIERLVVRVACDTASHAVRLDTSLRARVRQAPAAAAPAAVSSARPAATPAAQPAAQPSAAAPPAPPPAATFDYPGVRAVRFEVTTPGARARLIDLARITPAPPAPLGRRSSGAKDALDLSSLYDNDGLLGDSDSNLIPDRTDVLLVPDGPGIRPVIDLAARVALESAGVSLPLVVLPGTITAPATEPTLVLIGTRHPLIDQLVAAKKFDRSDLAPGQGIIRLVRKAFGDKSALVVSGGDEAGLQRALSQLTERLPHLAARGKDRPTVDDVEEDVRRFVGGRSPAGQAAIGLYKAERLARSLAGKDIEHASVRFSVEKPAPGLAAHVRRAVAAGMTPASLDVDVEALDVLSARPVEADGRPVGGVIEIPSEVDEFWKVFRGRVVAATKKKQVIAVEARLSEPAALRRQIERDARAELLRAGAALSSTVVVLSAYKQGFSWLDEAVKPALAGRALSEVRIRFAEAGPPPEWKQQAMFIPTRWLHEIFPIDEILARDLNVDRSRIVFEKTPVGSPTYEVVATAPAGETVFRGTFEPRSVVRPYFDRFPDYEHVRVTTGWMTAAADGQTMVSQRIATDPERFWDHFQSRTLPAIYDYVMAQSDGKPRAEDAPHFGELVVDVTLSEPHERLGIDQEQISPMEALHEDVYFAVLHFFDVLGRLTRGAPLDYPGRIVPVMRARSDGAAGRATITFTGFAAPRPMVEIRYRERSGRSGRARIDIPVIAVDRPSAVEARVDGKAEGLDSLELALKVDSDADERDTLIVGTRAERVDQQVLSAEQVVKTVAALSALRSAGLYRDALAWPGLRNLTLAPGWTHDRAPDAVRRVALAANGAPKALPDIAGGAAPAAAGAPAAPIVQWETPIGNADARAILARLATLDGADVYRAGGSYLGQDIWALDLTSPVRSSHWSQAKATTLKPTAIFSGRQHANEVSSTSHLLKLAELLLTDAAYRPLLNKINVVIHPITNADGTQTAHDLWAISPDFMMHAGYLGSLGVDVTAAQWETDGIYPESKIRAQLWRRWLPDLFLNPHGYPSHEWVQPFSEYAAWVRNRVTEGRDWWGMRGWFMPGFAYIDDPKYPRHKDAAFEIRRRIAAAVNAVPEVKALNARAYDRYRRYGHAWNQEDFKLAFTDGVLIYSAIKGGRPNPRGTDPMARQPNITVWSGTTEAPDEPASGAWLKLVAQAGLAWDRAMLDYLAEGTHEVERKRDAFFGGVTLSLSRARPPKK